MLQPAGERRFNFSDLLVRLKLDVVQRHSIDMVELDEDAARLDVRLLRPRREAPSEVIVPSQHSQIHSG